jgi:serralysin
MAQLTTGANAAFRMDEISVASLWDGDVTEQSATSLVIDTGDGYVERFTGTGVTYDGSGNPTAGTITGIQETLRGNPTFTLTDADVSAPAFAGWVDRGDDEAALTAIFRGDDRLQGGTLDDVMSGFDGHDYLFGGAGADTLVGADGNDHLWGQSVDGGSDGGDLIRGGSGIDYIHGNAGNDTLDGGNHNDRLYGGHDNDLISGGNQSDTVNGNQGNDTIDGGAGDDWLRGGKDQDLIGGGEGGDHLGGDLGNDTLVGGAGADVLTGGDGADLFRFAPGDSVLAARDVVTDFQDGTDRLDLGFAVTSVLTGRADDLTGAISYAQSVFDNHSGTGEVAAVQVGGDIFVLFSGSGGGTVDSALQLAGSPPIDMADFV